MALIESHNQEDAQQQRRDQDEANCCHEQLAALESLERQFDEFDVAMGRATEAWEQIVGVLDTF